jgi:hypothetical protein
VSLLWEFLLKILRIPLVGQLNVTNIYDIIYPYCRGEMFASVMQAFRMKEEFDRFHARILKQFVPSCQLVQLQVERYELVQAQGETFAVYVQSIKDATAVLHIAEGEKEIVSRLVDGLPSTQRACFVFHEPPSSSAQLGRLSVVDRSVAYADCLIPRQPATFPVGRVEAHRPPERTARLDKSRVCFFCHKPGHVKRDGFQWRAQLSGCGQAQPKPSF